MVKKGETLDYLFNGHPTIQRTWAGLIRIWLATQGKTDDSATAVRTVQATDWGQDHSNNCLLELLPLPSPGIARWHYADWSSIPFLASRKAYRYHLMTTRTAKLRQLLAQHAPKCVLFYSVSPDYLRSWSKIAGVDFHALKPEEICKGNQGQSFTARFKKQGETLYVVVYHPVYTGLTKNILLAWGNVSVSKSGNMTYHSKARKRK